MNAPKQAKTRGAVIVTRVSTGEQAKEGTSLESQRDACRAKALAMALPIIAEYEDAGVSGSFLLTRAGMQSAIADIQAGRADTLICASLSRYSRDTEHQQAIKKQVRAAGGQIVFCDMTFEATPEGDLAFGIMGSFAEYERKVIRARTMKGRTAKAEAGIQTARSLRPYGYHIPTSGDVLRGDYPLEMLGRYVLVPEQASVVRRIFEEFASGGHSMHSIARALNTEGVPTPRGGSHWRPSTLRNMMVNPVYYGKAVYGRTQKRMDETRRRQINPATGVPYTSTFISRNNDPSQWIEMTAPAIISEELWHRAQACLGTGRSLLGGNPRRMLMLSGRIFCPHCGTRMTFVRNSGYTYYHCNQHLAARKLGMPAVCEGTLYPVAVTEAAVLTCFLQAATDPEVIQGQLAALAPDPEEGKRSSASIRREVIRVDKALQDLTAQEAATVQAQIAGIIAGASPSAYSGAFADIAAKRKDLEDRRGTLQQSLRRIGATAKPALSETGEAAIRARALEQMQRVLSSPDVEGSVKRAIIARVIDRVICRKGGAVVVFLPGVLPVPEMVAEDGLARDTVHGVSVSPALFLPGD